MKKILLLILCAISLGMNWPVTLSNPGAGGWQYRVPIIITNSGATVNDYQVYISTTSLGTTYKSRVSGEQSCCRFTDKNHKELSYWLFESTSNIMGYWVRVSTLTSTVPETIYMFYSNPYATSSSSCAATFIWGDDFNVNKLSSYSQLRMPDAGWGVSGGELFMSMDANENFYQTTLTAPLLYVVPPTYDYIAQTRVRGTPTVNWHNATIVNWNATNSFKKVGRAYVDAGRVEFTENTAAGASTTIDFLAYTANTVHLGLSKIGTTYRGYYSARGEVLTNTGNPSTNSTYSTPHLGLSAYSASASVMTMRFEYFFIRKFMATEPTYTIRVAEQWPPNPAANYCHAPTQYCTKTAHTIWRFNESTGTVIGNSAIIASTRTITLASTKVGYLTLGKFRNCLSLNGTTNRGTAADFYISTFTISGWIYLTGHGTYGKIFCKPAGATWVAPWQEWAIGFWQTTDQPTFSMSITTSTSKDMVACESIPRNVWTFLAIRHRTADTDIFINGEKCSYVPTQGPFVGSVRNLTQLLSIGNHHDIAGQLGEYFAGSIDDWRIEKEFCSDAEIKYLYGLRVKGDQ